MPRSDAIITPPKIKSKWFLFILQSTRKSFNIPKRFGIVERLKKSGTK